MNDHRSAFTPLGSQQSSMTEDQQLDLILEKLESLPEELKAADPKTYPNYEEEISCYLGDTTVVIPSRPKYKESGA